MPVAEATGIEGRAQRDGLSRLRQAAFFRNSPAPALHVQIKPLHERQALGIVQPGKAEVHQQARNARQGDDARLANLPRHAQLAGADLHGQRLVRELVRVLAQGTGHAGQPLALGAAHLAVERFSIVGLHRAPSW